MNGNFDFVFQGLNRLWVVSVILIFNGSPQKIVQRGQITAPRRPIDIRISADYTGLQKNVEFVLEKIGLISKVVFLVGSKSGLRTAPARQVFE